MCRTHISTESIECWCFRVRIKKSEGVVSVSATQQRRRGPTKKRKRKRIRKPYVLKVATVANASEEVATQREADAQYLERAMGRGMTKLLYKQQDGAPGAHVLFSADCAEWAYVALHARLLCRRRALGKARRVRVGEGELIRPAQPLDALEVVHASALPPAALDVEELGVEAIVPR